MLDLGASPDYKDSRGLTPLYHSAMVGGDPYCCELLLYDHAQLGYSDENGWQEIHQVASQNSKIKSSKKKLSYSLIAFSQACRHGNVQHLEHLLFYGAEMSAQNASGNTALHLCALYNQVHNQKLNLSQTGKLLNEVFIILMRLDNKNCFYTYRCN